MNRAAIPPGPLLVDVAGTALDAEDRELLAHSVVGGVILFTRNYAHPSQLAELTAQIRAVRPELLIAADTEGGRVQRFREGMTSIPAMRRLGVYAAADPQAGHAAVLEIAWLMATELAGVGVDMPLAPVVDVDYGVSGVIGDRAFGADAAQIADLAGAFAEGLRAAGSAATAKHFPGHGYVAADSHAELPVDDRDRAALDNDMAPYRALIAVGLDSVMMAHVRYPAVDALPASLSTRWITDILRGELEYTGVVFCDDLSMGAAAALGDYQERARLALAAGCDYLPVCNNRAAVSALVDRLPGDTRASRERRQRLQTLCCATPAANTLQDVERRDAAHRLIRLLTETA